MSMETGMIAWKKVRFHICVKVWVAAAPPGITMEKFLPPSLVLHTVNNYLYHISRNFLSSGWMLLIMCLTPVTDGGGKTF